jgi:transposase
MYIGLMKTILSARRDFQALELRRQQAASLFTRGRTQADVARALQVSRQSVSRWFRLWTRGGRGTLRAAGRAGRKPRLTTQQLQQIDRALRQGARAQGFRTNLWTLPRVAKLIERRTRVHYHSGHVWRIMRRLHWTLQRPARRARERNPEGISRWVSQRWPTIKKTRATGRPG